MWYYWVTRAWPMRAFRWRHLVGAGVTRPTGRNKSTSSGAPTPRHDRGVFVYRSMSSQRATCRHKAHLDIGGRCPRSWACAGCTADVRSHALPACSAEGRNPPRQAELVHHRVSGHAGSSRVPTSPSRGFDQPERVSVRNADARCPRPAPPLRPAGYRLLSLDRAALQYLV